MNFSSGTMLPWGLSGVPASVPAAIGTPPRTASSKLRPCASRTARAFRTMNAGIPAASPPPAIAWGAISVGTR